MTISTSINNTYLLIYLNQPSDIHTGSMEYHKIGSMEYHRIKWKLNQLCLGEGRSLILKALINYPL